MRREELSWSAIRRSLSNVKMQFVEQRHGALKLHNERKNRCLGYVPSSLKTSRRNEREFCIGKQGEALTVGPF